MNKKSSTKPFRLLYLPNEPPPFIQAGQRAAFEKMLDEQIIDGYLVFSFMQEAQTCGSPQIAIEKLIKVAHDFQPTVIFWQHVSVFPITADTLVALQDLQSQPFLVYHEGDAYGKFRKRITASMKLLTRHADLTFLIGLGELAQDFKNAGAKEVLYAPHCADTTRFGKKWDANENKQNGVVMIGNLIDHNPVLRAIPLLRFPGALERNIFANKVYKQIGRRLKVYGRGWEKYPFAAGYLPFDSQEKVLRQNLFSINWDHYPDLPFYFSDRLPISMISGIPHMTNYHPGYELLFKNGEHLIYYRSIEDAVAMIDWMLCQSSKYLREMGRAGESYVRENLTSDVVFRKMVAAIKEKMLAKNT